jgi:hypothetical protein
MGFIPIAAPLQETFNARLLHPGNLATGIQQRIQLLDFLHDGRLFAQGAGQVGIVVHLARIGPNPGQDGVDELQCGIGQGGQARRAHAAI